MGDVNLYKACEWVKAKAVLKKRLAFSENYSGCLMNNYTASAIRGSLLIRGSKALDSLKHNAVKGERRNFQSFRCSLVKCK
jgi:hypothetical protein